MERPYRQITWNRAGEVLCVRLVHKKMDEPALEEMGAELGRLIDEENARKIVLDLCLEEPLCLYSVFLAKLVTLHRRLHERSGAMALSQVSEAGMDIFDAAGLRKFFSFYPDQTSAVAALAG